MACPEATGVSAEAAGFHRLERARHGLDAQPRDRGDVAQAQAQRLGSDRLGKLEEAGDALLLLALVALALVWESVERLLSPQRIAYDEALLVAVIGLVVNLASAYILGAGHAHDHDHDHGHAHDGGRAT